MKYKHLQASQQRTWVGRKVAAALQGDASPFSNTQTEGHQSGQRHVCKLASCEPKPSPQLSGTPQQLNVVNTHTHARTHTCAHTHTHTHKL